MDLGPKSGRYQIPHRELTELTLRLIRTYEAVSICDRLALAINYSRMILSRQGTRNVTAITHQCDNKEFFLTIQPRGAKCSHKSI
jgi:hypothetical protein